jgi:hypothetical protein
MRPLLAYIAASERSGSTLLELLLNNCSGIQSVGEVHRLELYARTAREPCTCGEPIRGCPFWLRVEAEGQRALGLPSGTRLLGEGEMMLRSGSLGRVGDTLEKAALLLGSRRAFGLLLRHFAPIHDEAIERSLFWYAMIRRATGCPIVLDSSKDVRRMKALYLADPEPFRVLRLYRDGRAVTASAMARRQIPMEQAAHEWREVQRRLELALVTLPPKHLHRLHYEELCTNPRAVLGQLSAFLGVPFEEPMLALRKAEAHGVGGNPMRFRRGEAVIQLDDRWRTDLDAADLVTFDRIAGSANARYGYSRS